MDNSPAQPNQPAPIPQPQAPYSNQPVYGQGQPYQQPYAGQPMQKPPRQPMDPAKKKKLIIGISAGVGVAALAVAAAIIIPALLKIDYSSTYKIAKELKPKIYDIYYSYDCEYVMDYLDSSYTSTKNYAEYIDGCKEIFGANTADLVAQLGNTDGIKKNSELSAQYEKFDAEFSAVSSSDADELNTKLDIYQAWHGFVVAKSDLSWGGSSDAEITTAANYLINSGNEILKTYGDGWLERALEVAAAYRDWDNTLFSNPERNSLYNTYRDKYSEREDWIAANKPDVTSVAQLNFDDTAKVYNTFDTLYNMITETYENNYNSGSGDCTEFMGTVHCE